MIAFIAGYIVVSIVSRGYCRRKSVENILVLWPGVARIKQSFGSLQERGSSHRGCLFQGHEIAKK